MIQRADSRQDNMAIGLIMEIIQAAKLPHSDQDLWRAALQRADRQQLSDIYKSLKERPDALNILTRELTKASS